MANQITPCLWFNGQAEEAAKFYCSVFKDGEINKTSYYPEAGKENHSFEVGSVMMVAFTINGTSFTGLNGGPQFPHNQAVSFQISCKDQEEIDYYWERLGEGGNAKKSVCGWLEDKYGVSWQVFPAELIKYISEGTEKGERAYKAMLGMTKIEIDGLRKAYDGEE